MEVTWKNVYKIPIDWNTTIDARINFVRKISSIDHPSKYYIDEQGYDHPNCLLCIPFRGKPLEPEIEPDLNLNLLIEN